jgi:hypothetical protein
MDSPVPQDSGSLFQVLAANPAAGAEWAYQLPINYRYRLQSVYYRFTSDANVANRNMGISVYTLAQMHFHTGFRNWQVASLIKDYCLFPGAFDFLAAADTLQICSIPSDFMLRGFDILQSETLNRQATDQYTNIILDFLRWPERSV